MTYPVATVIFLVLVVLVLGLGFYSARFGGERANHIEEWTEWWAAEFADAEAKPVAAKPA